jgi:hypothetical protein
MQSVILVSLFFKILDSLKFPEGSDAIMKRHSCTASVCVVQSRYNMGWRLRQSFRKQAVMIAEFFSVFPELNNAYICICSYFALLASRKIYTS